MGILSILRKKKKEEPVILTVKTLIPELLGRNLKKITGNTSEIELVQIKFTNWQIYLSGEDNGYILKFFRSSTRSPFLVFFPSDFIATYLPSINGKDISSELLKFLGDLPLYLLPEEIQKKDSVGDSVEKADFPEYICSELKGKDEVLWQTSGAGIFTVKFESVLIYLFLGEEEILQFNNRCQESGITPDLIGNLLLNPVSILSNEAIEDHANIVSKEISNEAEFLFGRFFLPRSILLGEHSAISGFDNINWGSENVTAETGVSFALTFTINDKLYSINYFIAAKGESNASLTKIMQALLKAVLPVWRRFFEISNVGGGLRRGALGGGKALLSGRIKYQNSQIPIKVSLSEDILSLFSSRFLETEELMHSDFSRIISLNQELLHIFFRDNLFPSMTLSEFFNLIDDFDLKKIVQNYFSGTGWNSEAMQPLFTYSRKVIEAKKIYYFSDPLFNRSRFFGFLPKSQKDEWKRTKGASGSREEMISSGRKALKEIYKAFKDDHLDLSFKSSILLRNEFKIRGEEKIRKELDLLMQREPLSVLIGNKFARDVQNLVAGLTAKVLANALVLYTDNLKSLESFMSRNYRVEVKELIKIVQRKSAADGFEMEDIRIDLLALHNGLKDLLEEEII